MYSQKLNSVDDLFLNWQNSITWHSIPAKKGTDTLFDNFVVVGKTKMSMIS